MTAEKIIDDILKREGSTYTDDPSDRGGPTKYGITLETLRDHRAPAIVRASDVEALTEPEARAIYLLRYLAPFETWVPDAALSLVVDCAVNHGVDRAVVWLQRALGVVEDGVVGPETRNAAKGIDGRVLYRVILSRRIRTYGLLAHKPGQLRFLNGWLARACEFVEATP